MIISTEDLQKIHEYGAFLQKKGYSMSCSEYGVVYVKENISFKVYFERYGDTSYVDIYFKEFNEYFSVGWIACVREHMDLNPHNRLEHVKVLLNYIETHYEQILNYDYCKQSDPLIHEFIEKRRTEKMKDLQE